MATVTIRNLSQRVVANIKHLASARGWSMEQEIRALLEQRYTARTDTWARVDQMRREMKGTLPARDIVAARHLGRK